MACVPGHSADSRMIRARQKCFWAAFQSEMIATRVILTRFTDFGIGAFVRTLTRQAACLRHCPCLYSPPVQPLGQFHSANANQSVAGYQKLRPRRSRTKSARPAANHIENRVAQAVVANKAAPDTPAPIAQPPASMPPKPIRTEPVI
jgi:hypothetical protein